jgi:hypothetical protein
MREVVGIWGMMMCAVGIREGVVLVCFLREGKNREVLEDAQEGNT